MCRCLRPRMPHQGGLPVGRDEQLRHHRHASSARPPKSGVCTPGHLLDQGRHHPRSPPDRRAVDRHRSGRVPARALPAVVAAIFTLAILIAGIRTAWEQRGQPIQRVAQGNDDVGAGRRQPARRRCSCCAVVRRVRHRDRGTVPAGEPSRSDPALGEVSSTASDQRDGTGMPLSSVLYLGCLRRLGDPVDPAADPLGDAGAARRYVPARRRRDQHRGRQGVVQEVLRLGRWPSSPTNLPPR